MTLETLSLQRCFGGLQGVYRHPSVETACQMRFAVFLPPSAERERVPAVFWLSGLTCTHENFVTKAGAQRVAAELGLALVVPDTSPRGLGYPGEDASYDFGTGAGFYVDATQAPWSRGYRMYSYVTVELPAMLAAFPIDAARLGICGHSMGGHGALSIALKRPDLFRTVSALAPIASIVRSGWGQRALAAYLGPDERSWLEYDVPALLAIRGWRGPPILVDQGSADEFLERELKPEVLEAACMDAGVPLELRRQAGYDHSYFFIATFIEDHLRHHARGLA